MTESLSASGWAWPPRRYFPSRIAPRPPSSIGAGPSEHRIDRVIQGFILRLRWFVLFIQFQINLSPFVSAVMALSSLTALYLEELPHRQRLLPPLPRRRRRRRGNLWPLRGIRSRRRRRRRPLPVRVRRNRRCSRRLGRLGVYSLYCYFACSPKIIFNISELRPLTFSPESVALTSSAPT